MNKAAIYVRRTTWYGLVEGTVEVSDNPDSWVTYGGDERLTDGASLCLKGFRKAFGFTPRKGKLYRITIKDVAVEVVE